MKYYFLVFVLCGFLFLTGTVSAASLVGPSGTVKVGDSWQIVLSNLNAGETVYATGGKIKNNTVPTDRTPYGPATEFRGISSIIINGTFTADDVGVWKLVWARASGGVIGTLNFTVVAPSGGSNGGSDDGGSSNIYHGRVYNMDAGLRWVGDNLVDANGAVVYNPMNYIYTAADAVKPIGVRVYGGENYVPSHWTRFDANQTTAVQNINAFQQARNDGFKDWINSIADGLRSVGHTVSIGWQGGEPGYFITGLIATINVTDLNYSTYLSLYHYDDWTKSGVDPVARIIADATGKPYVLLDSPSYNSSSGSDTTAKINESNLINPSGSAATSVGGAVGSSGWIQNLNRIIQNAKNMLNSANSSIQTLPADTTSSSVTPTVIGVAPVVSDPDKDGTVAISIPAPQTARYVKFLRPTSVSSPGLGPVWTGLREIEIFDSAGVKIPIATSTASNWQPAGASENYAQTPDKAYDGDTKTYWYNGPGDYQILNGTQVMNTCTSTTKGTYPKGISCANNYGGTFGNGAGDSHFNYTNAWAQFDLGSPKTISKIKLWGYYIQNQYPLIDQILVSSDGATFTKIFEFQYSDKVNHIGVAGLGSNGRDNIGCLNWPDGIQQAKGSCEPISTPASPSSLTTVTTFPATVTVRISNLNVRSGPHTTSPLAGSRVLHAGEMFTAVAVAAGDDVEGENRWWRSSQGNYIWSGGTVQAPPAI